MSIPPEQPPASPPPANPADPATEPLNPVAQRQARGPYRAEPYVADPRPAEAAFWRLEGLRTALTIVGLIAVIAVGLAVWALLRSEHNNRRVTGGAPGTIAALTTRVDRLQATVRSLRSSGGTRATTPQSLAAQVSALQQTEKQLSTRIGHAGNGAQVTQLASKESALSAKVSQLTGKEAALSGQVSQLQGRVASLAGQVAQAKAQTTTQTITTGTSTTP